MKKKESSMGGKGKRQTKRKGAAKGWDWGCYFLNPCARHSKKKGKKKKRKGREKTSKRVVVKKTGTGGDN